jgi:hypothetical protein
MAEVMIGVRDVSIEPFEMGGPCSMSFSLAHAETVHQFLDGKSTPRATCQATVAAVWPSGETGSPLFQCSRKAEDRSGLC